VAKVFFPTSHEAPPNWMPSRVSGSVATILRSSASARLARGASWLVGKKTFATLHDYGKGLTAYFWVGIERQGPLEMDPRFSIPPYQGHNGWIALDMEKGAGERELRDFLVGSWRHFAPRRAIVALDATLRAV
jgi:hypothetical protein